MSAERYARMEAMLQSLPPAPPVERMTWQSRLRAQRGEMFTIEAAAAVEVSMAGIGGVISPELQTAFELQYPRLAEQTNIAEHYEVLMERGPESVEGFTRALRGKLFETRLPEQLEAEFPGYTFELAPGATTADWDLRGMSGDGTELLVQAKARAASAASDVISTMEGPNAPEVFAVTSDLHAGIVGGHPELAERLVEIDTTSLALNEDVEAMLTTSVAGLGLKLPESLLAMSAYATEIVLGAKLVYDIVQNNRALATIPRGDRSRTHAVRALALMARFGVSAVLTTLSSTAGLALFGPIGGIIGALTGAFVAGRLNRKIQPLFVELGLELAGFDLNDIFYLQNCQTIDAVGMQLRAQRVALEARLGTAPRLGVITCSAETA